MKSVTLFLLLICVSISSFSANITWTNGNSTGIWNDAGNWSAGVPGTADVAIFDGTSTANCLIDISIDVRGISIRTGYTGTLTQGNGNTIIIRDLDFFIAEGNFVGGDSEIDMLNGNFQIRGGNFLSTSANLVLDVNFVVADSGSFAHNNGTVVFNDGGNRSINVINKDTLFNMVVEPTANNARLDLNNLDTLVVINKLALNNGRLRGGPVEVLDTVELNPAYDLGTNQIWLKGSGNGLITANGDVGTHPFFISKENPTDTVFVKNDLGAIVEWGNTSDRLTVVSGTLVLTKEADLDFNELEIRSGASFAASNQETRFFGAWDNQGGNFNANGGTWRWDIANTRNYRSTVVDTFFNFIYQPTADRELRMLADDSAFVINKLELLNGRIQTGHLLVEDTAILYATYDDGTADLWFKGSTTSNFIIEAAQGNFDKFIVKDNPTDTVFYQPLTGNSLNIGEPDRDLSIQRGVLSFSLADTVDLDYGEIDILSGAELEATAGLTTYQGSWNNVGGKFNANGGEWIWDNNGNRGYATTEIDTFYTLKYQPTAANAALVMFTDDSIYIENRLDLTEGRILSSNLLVNDSAFLYATYDNGNADVWFVGSTTSNFFIEAAVGDIDFFIRKENPTDTVFFQPFTGNTLNIGETDRDLSIQEGILSFDLVENVNLDFSDIIIQPGAQLNATSGTTNYQGSWNNQGGLFNANQGNWIWDNNGNRSYLSTEVDTFFNFNYNPIANNVALSALADDSIYILNKLELSNGRIQTGHLLVEDTAYLYATYDDATADLWFVGDVTSNFIIEAAQGNFDKFIVKDSPTDTVFFQPLTGNSLNIGETDKDLTIQEGILSFDLVQTANLDYSDIFIEAGAQLQASPGITRFQGNWNNIAGDFDHNNGTWIVDPAGNRTFTSHQTDTFHRFIFQTVANNRVLTITTGDQFAVEQALFLNNGRMINGNVIVLDTLEINADNDNGTANMRFQGPTDGTFISNANRGRHDIFIDKDNPSIKVDFIDENGDLLNVGNGNMELFVLEGRVEFPSNDTVNCRFINVDLFSGGTFQPTSGILNFFGNWNNNQGKLEANGGTFVFLNSTNRSYLTTEVDTFFNFTYNSNGNRVLSMGSVDTIRVINQVDLVNGRIRTGVISAIGDVRVRGTYDGDNGQAALQFVGPNPQSFDLTGGVAQMDGDIYFDKSVAEEVTLNSLLDVDRGGQAMHFNKGYLVTTQTNVLFVDGAHPMIGPNDSSFVKGPVTKRGNQTFTFPIGDTIYAPMTISNISSGSAQFRGQYFKNDPTDDAFDAANLGPGLNNVSINEYWLLDRLATTASCRVNLSWRPTSGVAVPAEITVARWNSGASQWEDQGASFFTGDLNNGSVTSPVLTTFSPFTLASTSMNNPLPVTYKYFEVTAQVSSNLLEWVTISELNAAYFDVEKSLDGDQWESIGRIQANGNSNREIYYQYTDFDINNNLTYYRLKQVDFDGTTDSTDVRIIDRTSNKSGSSISVYPNPTLDGTVYIKLESGADENVELLIYSLDGQQMRSTYFRNNEGSSAQRIRLDLSNFPKGTYIMQFNKADGIETKKLIVL